MPVQFGDLPPDSHRNAWAQEADELRAYPGEWAVVTTKTKPNQARMMASNIRAGRVTAFRPAEAFEATSRGTDVWARYIGDEAES